MDGMHEIDEASPKIQERIRASFARQGLMSHLGARLTHIGPGRVHIALPHRIEVTQQDGYIHAGRDQRDRRQRRRLRRAYLLSQRHLCPHH